MDLSKIKKIVVFIFVLGMVVMLVPFYNNEAYAKPHSSKKPKLTEKSTETPTPTKTPNPNELHEVETVDSISKGVTINMYDYSSAAAIGTGYYKNSGEITQGILSKKTQTNGFPKVINNNTNLSKWFSSTGDGVKDAYENCNNLFIKSEYDSTGDFYYSCFDNYAKLDMNKNSTTNTYLFTVYEELGTPSNENRFYFQRGNFMPFNSIYQNIHSTNRNVIGIDGKTLATTAPNYNADLHKTNDNNYYFGMNMEAEFVQLKDGHVNGEDMVFEFIGDDDLWIYIDGVLVLDLGGIHDAHSGSINFATGEIKEDTSTQSTSSTKISNIKQRYIDALGKKNAAEYFKDGANIYKDYSEHKIQMFYMERGDGASNCYLRFNLPTIPKDRIKIQKEITGSDKTEYGEEDFGYKLYVQKEDGNGGFLSNQYETYIPKTGDLLIDGENKAQLVALVDGTFYLKSGQAAEINNIDENRKYYVEEIDINKTDYDTVAINGTTATVGGTTAKLVAGSSSTTFNVQTCISDVGSRKLVLFENHASDDKVNNLIIKKEMAGIETSNDSFEFELELENKYGEMEKYKGEYYVYDNNQTIEDAIKLTTENGIITLKATQTAVIKNLLAGTDFYLIEKLSDTQIPIYVNKNYLVNNVYDYLFDDESTDCAAGIIKNSIDAIATVTNSRGNIGELKITKSIDILDLEDGDAIFSFMVEQLDRDNNVVKTLFRSVRFNNESVLSKAVTIGKLPIATYRVTELSAIRYTCQSQIIQSKTMTENNRFKVEVEYINKKTNNRYFGDTDEVINEFTIDEDGKIVINQNRND